MKKKVIYGLILLILIISSVCSCRKAGLWLIREDKLLHADAIVILMGSIGDRVLEAFDIYMLNLSGKVIIAEEYMDSHSELKDKGIDLTSNSEQVKGALVTLGIPGDSIVILPGDARSTVMEALIIRDYIDSNSEIDTLLLVSSSYHTYRAVKIFESAFRNAKNPVCIIPCPSKYTGFDAVRWWRDKEGIQTVLMEYLKVVNFMLIEKKSINKRTGRG